MRIEDLIQNKKFQTSVGMIYYLFIEEQGDVLLEINLNIIHSREYIYKSEVRICVTGHKKLIEISVCFPFRG